MADVTDPRMGSSAPGQLSLDFAGAGPQPAAAKPRVKLHLATAAADEKPNVKTAAGNDPPRRRKTADIAEAMAAKQREISVSEFFAKNRHLLGFDNPRKALLTTVKEGVDNSLDACEEAGILPDVAVEIHQITEDRFRVVIQDNGPGIVKEQIPRIFGSLLYGSKFHRLKMSRGQQGIGISAAGMYGVLTTGKSMRITSRTGPHKPAHHYAIQIDTQQNRPDIIEDREVEFELEHGTRVEIELAAKYQKGRTSVDEYIEQTAIANPHASFRYRCPSGEWVEFPRGTQEMPPDTKEIKPHPHGIEMGLLMKMLKDSPHKTLSGFLQKEFCRVTGGVALDVITRAELTPKARPARIAREQVEVLYNAIQSTKMMAPPTDCLAPIGTRQILAGLLKGVQAAFYTATTRKPAVYRGNPFQIEVGLAYGGDLPTEDTAKLIRYANRVPLLYQQSACSIYKSTIDVNWKQYGLGQSRDALPEGPLVIMVHMASVWVPFTSESKEAIADYDDIHAEIKLALQECGRKLAAFIRRRQRSQTEGERRKIWERYIDEVVNAVGNMTRVNRENLRKEMRAMLQERTERADEVLDENGKPIVKPEKPEPVDDSTVIVEERVAATPAPTTLFENGNGNGSGAAIAPKTLRRAS